MNDKRSPDDFWDLASLLPKKRPAVMRQPSTDTEPVTVEIDAKESSNTDSHSLSFRFREVPSSRPNSRSDQKPVSKTAATAATTAPPTRYGSQTLPPRGASRQRPTAENVLEYEPGGGLVKRVKIMRWPTTYSFYEQFRSDAIRCRTIPGKPCAHVPFFSYTPQYRQMSQSQLEYYFYWRGQCRQGIFGEADFAYILLYVYEIINLYTTDFAHTDDTEDKSRGLDMLSDLWLNYRGKYKTLDKYLSEWLPDYCLIHRLPPPVEKLAPIMSVITETTSFREFFMTDNALSPETLIALSSDYDWRKSKYVTEGDPDRINEFKTHLEGALRRVTESGDERFTAVSMTPARASRDAFCGSLCAHSIKRRIDVEYISFTRSHDLRTIVTAIVKYSENKLRAHFGIKSRLKVDGLDERTKDVIDAYFAAVYPTDRRYVSRTEAEKREERYYEEMYGALSVGIDETEARKLEDASWSVTERLTELDDTVLETEDAVFITEAESAPCDEPAPSNANGALTVLHLDVLRAINAGDVGTAASLCHNAGRYLDEIVSEINEYAADEIGDVIIEHDGASYSAIEDYADEIASILENN